MRYFRQMPSRFRSYYAERPKSHFFAYLFVLLIGFFIGKGWYDWSKVTDALKMDQEFKSQIEQKMQNKQYDEVIKLSNSALSLRLKTFWKDYGTEEQDYYNMAMAWKGKGEIDKAIEALQTSLGIAKSKYGEENPFVLQVQQTLSTLTHR